MSENIEYRAEFNIDDIVNKYVERVNREIDQRVLDKVEHRLAEYGYVKVVRCRDCKYYHDGTYNGRRYAEPHCLAIGELAYGALFEIDEDCFCSWGERKEVRE